MLLRFLVFCVGLVALTPAKVLAHPHVYVDTGLKLSVDDQGRAVGVEVSWAYDPLYSLLTFEDLGLDNDYDGKLSQDELVRLNGFDMKWVDDFEGDLYVETPNSPVTLGRPEARGVAVEDARIISTHFRAFSEPVPAHGLILRAYDPTFYTAYDLTLGVKAGTCAVTVTPADLDAAYTLVEELLYARPASDAEDDFPKVGAAFADTVVISCRN